MSKKEDKPHKPMMNIPPPSPLLQHHTAMNMPHFAIPGMHSMPPQFPMGSFFPGGHPPPMHMAHHPQFNPMNHNMTNPSASQSILHLNDQHKQIPKPQKQQHSSVQSNSSKSKNTIPATIPTVQVELGIEYITFTYSVKGVSKEYKIRTDIDGVLPDDIDFDFKQNNCVYPRAYIPKDKYTGNRWDYETTVNNLGWRLAWINQNALCGKRGLIQRAVDSYRNRFPEMRSRRVVRQEKLIKGTLRKRSERPADTSSVPSPVLTARSATASDKIVHQTSANQQAKTKNEHQQSTTNTKRLKSAKSLTFEMIVHGAVVKTRIRCDLEAVSLSEVSVEFKGANAVYPRAHETTAKEYTASRYEREVELNEIGWKLAWLNPAKLAGNKAMLQRALDSFRCKFGEKPRKGKSAVEEVTFSLFANSQASSSESDSSSSVEDDVAVREDDDGLLSDGMSAAELLHGLVHGS